MKKLKCESCGGLLNIEESGEYAYCDYCKTKYKLNEDKTITFKMDDNVKDAFSSGLKTMSKYQAIFTIIPIAVFILIAAVMGFGIYQASKQQMNESNTTETRNYDLQVLTTRLELYSGTKATIFVKNALDEIVTYNKKHVDNPITVTFEAITTPDVTQIVEIKKKLDDNKKYEIMYDYDSNGYINNMNIQK